MRTFVRAVATGFVILGSALMFVSAVALFQRGHLFYAALATTVGVRLARL